MMSIGLSGADGPGSNLQCDTAPRVTDADGGTNLETPDSSYTAANPDLDASTGDSVADVTGVDGRRNDDASDSPTHPHRSYSAIVHPDAKASVSLPVAHGPNCSMHSATGSDVEVIDGRMSNEHNGCNAVDPNLCAGMVTDDAGL